MKTKNILIPAVCFLLFCSVACGTNSNHNALATTDTTQQQPADTDTPNTHYKPAFPGQTRITPVKTTTAYTSELMTKNLGSPWATAVMPDGRFLITERSGYMMILDNNGKLVKKITGFPAVDYNGQGGMLDVALDPDFNKNKIIYWSFSEKQGEGNLLAVAKGQLDETKSIIVNPQVIFRATPAMNSANHFGSRLVFDKDGNLFVSTGERFILEGRRQAQLLNSHLGKIFKITKDGKPAPGNPFLSNKDAMPEIFAYGIRNCQSLAINPVTGELWEAEFGPRGGDEVNIIRAGKNYGWPVITYGIEYSGEKIGDGIQQHEGMEQPVYYWDPVLSPSGMTFYTGDNIPEWKNNLFICGLSSAHIARLVIENNKIVGEEKLLADKKERFRDIACYNGTLFTVTDSGNLYKISKK